jgi:integrase
MDLDQTGFRWSIPSEVSAFVSLAFDLVGRVLFGSMTGIPRKPMARPRKHQPNYRLHKASGQAVVTLGGKDVYLGKFGTDASKDAYERAVLTWRNGGSVVARKAQLPPLTIAGMVAAFWRHVEADGLYWKAGKPTSERGCLALALRPLVELFGSTAAADFKPRDLRVVRDAMVRPVGEKRTKLTRQSANKHTHRIRLVFRWAVAESMVPASVWESLCALEPLARGRGDVLESEPIGPAPLRAVVAVLRVVDPHIAALIRLGWLTGARPGELVQLRAEDIDRTRPVWIFRPGRHKNEHRGQSREVPIGPRAQRVLAPYLQARPSGWIFAGRMGQHLTEAAYGTAICRARRSIGCQDWTPNMLRHSAATRIRKRFGIDSARTILGHSDVSMTATYAEADRAAAAKVAAAIG